MLFGTIWRNIARTDYSTRGCFLDRRKARARGGNIGTSERVAIGLSVSVVVLIVLSIAGTYLYRQHVAARAHSIFVSAEAATECKPLVDAYMKGHPEAGLVYASRDDAGLVLSTTREDGMKAVEIAPVPELRLDVGYRAVILRPQKKYVLSCMDVDEAVERLVQYMKEYHGNQESVTLTAAGDIIPGRTVAKMMALKGVTYPYGKIAPCLKGADVVFADLEAPLSDRVKPPYQGTNFIAPASTVQGLKLLGLNMVTLANNHSTNFGTAAFSDTLGLLEDNGIKYAGGGMDLTEARSPGIIEARGVSFAFLSYNSISGSINATATSPGVSWIRMKPWSKDSSEDLELVKRSIGQAKSEGHFVVACFHWSAEYTRKPSESQRNLAHLACDAGADLVVGSHPHCTQSIEMYRGKLIAYSLGNFVFDQMEHDYSREGFILKCRFNGRLMTGIELVPYVITDWCQPVAASGLQAKKILEEVLGVSGY